MLQASKFTFPSQSQSPSGIPCVQMPHSSRNVFWTVALPIPVGYAVHPQQISRGPFQDSVELPTHGSTSSQMPSALHRLPSGSVVAFAVTLLGMPSPPQTPHSSKYKHVPSSNTTEPKSWGECLNPSTDVVVNARSIVNCKSAQKLNASSSVHPAQLSKSQELSSRVAFKLKPQAPSSVHPRYSCYTNHRRNRLRNRN